MDKLDYTDFNKFLSSIGVLLIALSIILPWLFLKEPFDLLIEAEKIKTLTPVAQKVITLRQNRAMNMITVLPFISLGILVSGILVLAVGLFLWYKRQVKIEDVKSNLEIDKSRKELEKMSESEINKRVEQEVIEANLKGNEAEKLNKSDKSTIRLTYRKIEQIVAEKINNAYSNHYKVLKHYRIGNLGYDIIMQSINENKDDYIIEIKYVNNITLVRLREIIRQIQFASIHYTAEVEKIAIPILIFVFSNKNESKKDVKLLLEELKLTSEFPDRIFTIWQYITIGEKELDSIEITKLLKIE